MLMNDRNDNMASQFLNLLSGDVEPDALLPISDWTAVRSQTTAQGYQWWEIAMSDDSVLEINPIPASAPNETWLYAVACEAGSGAAVLVQGHAVEQLYQACARTLATELLTTVAELKTTF